MWYRLWRWSGNRRSHRICFSFICGSVPIFCVRNLLLWVENPSLFKRILLVQKWFLLLLRMGPTRQIQEIRRGRCITIARSSDSNNHNNPTSSSDTSTTSCNGLIATCPGLTSSIDGARGRKWRWAGRWIRCSVAATSTGLTTSYDGLAACSRSIVATSDHPAKCSSVVT